MLTISELSQWLTLNIESLTESAVAKLSGDENLKAQVAQSVQAFFIALGKVLDTQDSASLNKILRNWVEARSAPSGSDLSSLVTVLTTLKQVVWERILQNCPPPQALNLLTQSDAVFAQATIYLSMQENNAFLRDMRLQLQKAQERIKYLDNNKSNFIAVAAHELRTPLTLVEGYLDMLVVAMPLQGPQESQLVDGIRAGTRRLRDIINDIIDVALLDLQIMEFHFQPVWLMQVIRAAERNISKIFADRMVNLSVQSETITSDPTYGDPDRLLQAIQKIMMNAVKYTPDGGTVTIQGRSLPGLTDITISDNGIGISSENLPLIFDSFSALGDASLHSSGKTKFKGGGPGLGLPIARGIVEAHGGTVWAESDGYDEVACPGSTFHIMIPMRDAAPEAPVWKIEVADK